MTQTEEQRDREEFQRLVEEAQAVKEALEQMTLKPPAERLKPGPTFKSKKKGRSA